MSFVGKSPKFESVIYKDQAAGSVPNPAAGSHKLINRNGALVVRNSGGSESTIPFQSAVDAKQDDVITTRGDIVYGNASGNAARLGLGPNGQVLGSNGTDLVWTTSGSGDVLGPATSTDNTIARFNGTNNKTIQGSGVSIDDSNNIDNVTSLDLASNLKLNSDDTITGCASISFHGGGNTLNYYKTNTHSTTWTYDGGTGTSSSVTMRFTRIGNIVSCTVKNSAIASVTSGSPTSYSIDSAFPAEYRPAQTTQFVMRAQNNGTRYVAVAQITASGGMTIFPTISGGNFSGLSGYPDPFVIPSWSVD